MSKAQDGTPPRRRLARDSVSRALLVANSGLITPAALMVRLGLEGVVDATVRLSGRVGGSCPGRKVCSLVAAMLAGGSHIDVLRSGATERVLPFRVMAPSTLGTFLRSFTFGHVRQLDKGIAESLRRAWAAGARRGNRRLVIDVDSTICEVYGNRNRAMPGMGTRKCWAITRSSPPAQIPVRCCMPGCVEGRRTRLEARDGSLRLIARSVMRARRVSSWPGSIRGSGRTTRSRLSDVSGCVTRWRSRLETLRL